MAERIRLGELLVDAGLLSQATLAEALDRQKSDKRRLGELLVASGAVTEAQVTQVLSQQLSVPWVSLSHIDFSRQLLNLVPVETAQKYGVLPIYVRRGKNKEQTLYVAMTDPTETDALTEIAQHSGLPVKAMIAPPSDIHGAIRAYYLGLPPDEEPLPPPPPLPAMARPKVEPVELEAEPLPDSFGPERSESGAPKAPGAAEAPPDSTVPESGDTEVPSRDSRIPKPKRRTGEMVVVTLLDGTQIALPKRKPKEEREPGEVGLTAKDLVAALRAHAKGADVSGVLGEDAQWERLFAALLSLLMKKHLIHDWEFVRELKK